MNDAMVLSMASPLFVQAPIANNFTHANQHVKQLPYMQTNTHTLIWHLFVTN
jgi:hypothetical protein